jgi:hypothetical protein
LVFLVCFLQLGLLLSFFCLSSCSFTIAASPTSSFITLIIITFFTSLHLSNFFPITFLFDVLPSHLFFFAMFAISFIFLFFSFFSS